MKFRPLYDKILIRRSEAEEKTPGGLIIVPDNAKEKPTKGEILAVGNGKVLPDGTLRPLDVTANQVVIFNKYAGTEVEIDGEKLHILTENDILGVVEEP